MDRPHRMTIEARAERHTRRAGNYLRSPSYVYRRNTMSSRTFKARTTHSTNDPQLCGLHEASGCCCPIEGDDGIEEDVPGAIVAGQECFYLTCRGEDASPGMQIQRSNKKDGYSTGFRVIPSGRSRVFKDRRGIEHKKPIFKWQEQGSDGCWHDVKVWERMVHVACAEKLGYQVSDTSTSAFRGARTLGHAHRVNQDAISPLEELAAMEFEAEQEDQAEA